MYRIEKDIKKYQTALERAKAVGLYQYYAPLNRVIEAMREIQVLDEEFEEKKGEMGQFGL